MKEEELRCIFKLEKENSELVKKVKIGIKRLLNQNDQKGKEIEILKNEIKKISQQHIYTLEKLIETQTKIEKTIEYIKENEYIDLNGYDLLNILGGGKE